MPQARSPGAEALNAAFATLKKQRALVEKIESTVAPPILAPTLYDRVQTARASGPSRRGVHKLLSALSCARYHMLANILGLEPRAGNPDLIFGTLVHALIAYHYAARMPVERRPEWFQEPLIDVLRREARDLQQLIAKSQACYEAYAIAVEEEERNWVILCVEQEFEATLFEFGGVDKDKRFDQWPVTWKWDMLVLIFNALGVGRIYADDHKTMKPDSRTKRLPMWTSENEFWRSLQHCVYRMGIDIVARRHEWPYEIGDWYIDRISKEPPYPTDKRPVPPIPPGIRDAAIATLRQGLERDIEIHAQVARGEAPQPNLGHCTSYGRPCRFADLCWAPSKTAQAEVLELAYVRKA